MHIIKLVHLVLLLTVADSSAAFFTRSALRPLRKTLFNTTLAYPSSMTSVIDRPRRTLPIISRPIISTHHSRSNTFRRAFYGEMSLPTAPPYRMLSFKHQSHIKFNATKDEHINIGTFTPAVARLYFTNSLGTEIFIPNDFEVWDVTHRVHIHPVIKDQSYFLGWTDSYALKLRGETIAQFIAARDAIVQIATSALGDAPSLTSSELLLPPPLD